MWQKIGFSSSSWHQRLRKNQVSDFSFISLSSRLGTDATKQLCACKLQVHQVFIGPIRSQGKLQPNLPFHQIQNLDFYL